MASAFLPRPPFLRVSLPLALLSGALGGSRSVLGLSSSVVVDDGSGADEQAVGKTGCPNDARKG